MPELKFETGVVTFSVNGGVEVSFNPTDTTFAERLFDAFDALDKRQESYRAEVERNANKREVFDTARKMDAEMRETIDGIFERPVCKDIFGAMNVYALADGLPVWCNFMLAVMDEVDTTFAREQKATNPRIAKYTQKYHR